jgi:hypothetical protein
MVFSSVDDIMMRLLKLLFRLKRKWKYIAASLLAGVAHPYRNSGSYFMFLTLRKRYKIKGGVD